MFESSMVESRHLLRTTNRWTTLISLTIQLTAAAALIALPLLHPEALPFTTPKLTLVAPPKPPTTPPPQIVQTTAAASTPNIYSAPTSAPVIHSAQQPLGPEPIGESISPGMFPLDNGTLLALGNSNGAPHVIARAATQPPEPTPAKLTVSSGVAQGLLLTPLHPAYPSIAIATRTEGTVIIQATISRTGTIESAHVLSGPPLLQAAALDAVRQARYAPYHLNGQPVEVQTTFSLNFKLAN